MQEVGFPRPASAVSLVSKLQGRTFASRFQSQTCNHGYTRLDTNNNLCAQNLAKVSAQKTSYSREGRGRHLVDYVIG
jgi:hypothetical protein